VKRTILVNFVLSCLLAGCGTDPSSQYAYQAPEETDDGLDAGSLDEVNMDSTMLSGAVDTTHAGKADSTATILTEYVIPALQ
jgi:hypothetical protein